MLPLPRRQCAGNSTRRIKMLFEISVRPSDKPGHYRIGDDVTQIKDLDFATFQRGFRGRRATLDEMSRFEGVIPNGFMIWLTEAGYFKCVKP
jgi:hypothetical protein